MAAVNTVGVMTRDLKEAFISNGVWTSEDESLAQLLNETDLRASVFNPMLYEPDADRALALYAESVFSEQLGTVAFFPPDNDDDNFNPDIVY